MSKEIEKRRNCRLCEKNQYTPVYYLDEIEIARCNHCGFIQIASERSIQELKDHYSQSVEKQVRKLSRFETNKIVRASKFRANYFQKYTKLRNGRVLEVGSSAGHFLEELQKRDFDVEGIEPGPLSQRAEEKGIRIHKEMLENTQLPDSHYDAICMFQVFEHFEDPKNILKILYAKLKPGGHLVIETPDIYSIGSKFEKTPHKLFNKEHISYFSPDNLNALMKQFHFSSLITRHYDYDGFRLPFAKMLKRILLPILNPSFKGPLDKILLKEIEIQHRFKQKSAGALKNKSARRTRKPLRDFRKTLSAPLDCLFSYIAYNLDRGASFYGIYKKQ